MTKTKHPKPIKAWAVVGKDGVVWPRCIYRTRESARFFNTYGNRIVRVEIKVLK